MAHADESPGRVERTFTYPLNSKHPVRHVFRFIVLVLGVATVPASAMRGAALGGGARQ